MIVLKSTQAKYQSNWISIGFVGTLFLGFLFCLFVLPQIYLAQGTIQNKVATALPLTQAAVGFVNAWRYRFLGSTDDQVQIGKDGWLFISQDLYLATQPLENMQARAKAVITLAKALRSQGIQLMVAVVPSKARIQASSLRTAFPTVLQNGYRDFIDLLETSGVTAPRLDVPLLAAAQQQAVFLKTDTHWNIKGAKIAAQTVAQAALPLQLELPVARFQTIQSAIPQEISGDLIHLMGLEDVAVPFRPENDVDYSQQTQNLENSNSGLLGAPSSAVVLVGTSYSLRSNFLGALEQSLGTRVLSVAREGSGFEGNMTIFLEDIKRSKALPKLLIWEFNERFLYLPITKKLPPI